MEGLGAGLGAIAFWGFLAAVVVGGIWYGLRERQAQYATLQRMLDGSQPIDEAIVDKVLGGNRRMDLGLKVAAWIVLFTAPGLAVLGWFIGQLSPPWLMPIYGAAALVAFVGVGLLVASKVAERSYRDSGSVDQTTF